MRQIKIFLFFSIALTILFMAACGNPTASDELLPTASPDPTTSDKKEVSISVDYATDELLSKFDSFIDEYVEYEYAVSAIFMS